MKLRWLVTVSETGRKSEPELQRWNGECWVPVNTIECKTWEENDINEDPDLV